MPDFVAAIEELGRSQGPFAGIVGHSLGAAAAAYAVRGGLPAERLVLLAPPANPENYAARFAHHFHIPPGIRDGMKRRLEQRYGVGWTDLRLDAPLGYAPAKLLVFHDRADHRVPWKDGASIVAAWPASELVTTRGLGHHKILRDAAVIRRAVDFLAAGELGRAQDAGARRRRPARPVAILGAV